MPSVITVEQLAEKVCRAHTPASLGELEADGATVAQQTALTIAARIRKRHVEIRG